MNFFRRVQESVSRFMMGRYGTDTLNRHLIVLWLVLAIVNAFLHSLVVYIGELILCFATFFRMLSKNVVKRQRENASYYRLMQKWKRSFRHIAVRFRERKTTRFFKCPSCSAPIRMPRKVGRFNIRCQKCGTTFTKEFKR